MKKLSLIAALAFSIFILFPSPTSAGVLPSETVPEGVSVSTIWNNGKHCAFTSLVKFRGRYYCTFREGDGHVFDREGNANGRIRVLVSRNCRKWKSVALLSLEKCDLRDPKLDITPDGRLMLLMGGSYYVDKKLVDRVPQASFSSDGKHFSDPQPLVIDTPGTDGHWLWRVTWKDGVGYGVSYVGGEKPNEAELYLLKTLDGVHYDLVTKVAAAGFPNETTLRFLPDGRMAMAVRRDGKGMGSMLWGAAPEPFTEWDLKEVGFTIGGPDFLVLDENHIVLSGRSYGPVTTSVWVGGADGDFRKVMDLPASGDCSYPSLFVKGNDLKVIYYSEVGKSDFGSAICEIRMASIPLKLLFP